ncbi:hypothetical protein FPQ18DRAFT_398398, partial [Pyronema domesticum]
GGVDGIVVGCNGGGGGDGGGGGGGGGGDSGGNWLSLSVDSVSGPGVGRRAIISSRQSSN